MKGSFDPQRIMTHSLRTTALDDLITFFFKDKSLCVCVHVLRACVCSHVCMPYGTCVKVREQYLVLILPSALFERVFLLIAEYARQLTTLFVTCSSVKGRGSQAGGGEG